MKPSIQQQAAIDAVKDKNGGNLILEAVAGSGKTSTLLMMLPHMSGKIAFTAYNKAIATEIGWKVRASGIPNMGMIKAGTFHSFGFAGVMSACPGAWMDEKKVNKIMAAEKVPEGLMRFVSSLVSLAKQNAIGVLVPFEREESWWELVSHHDLEDTLLSNPFKREEFSELELESMVKVGMGWAQKVLRLAIEDRKSFDFDDMIYLPLVYNAPLTTYDWVLIDEAQDTNPARRALAKKMLKVGGRLVAVGDPHQAIYGFTGADADSLTKIAADFSTRTLPLSVTYRCARSVVRHAQQVVGHILPHPDAPEGTVTRQDGRAFIQDILPTLTNADVVLCRNVRPLVSLAFSLIRRKKGCHIEGRDIGRGLVALANKWSRVNTVEELRTKLEAYLAAETERLMARGEEAKAATLDDKIGSLLVVCDNFADDEPKASVIHAITDMFKDGDTSVLTLSTIHKSKGREWDTVYLYGRESYMPSPFARQQWQLGQESNLAYVAVTRARLNLVEVSAVAELSSRRSR